MNMTETRKGDWFVTFTGRRFYPLDPRVEDIDIRDIAHSLALQSRWMGHCKTHYSIASHALACARVAEMGDCHEDTVKWCLMHDASEAYVGDVIRPIKRSLLVDTSPPDCPSPQGTWVESFKALENRFHQLIAERFDLPEEMPDAVHEIDNRMLVTEAYHLTNYERDQHWITEKSWAHIKPYAGDHVLLHQTLEGAEQNFLARATEYLGL
jgi:hypothetical protein